jgi:hypothetical protein
MVLNVVVMYGTLVGVMAMLNVSSRYEVAGAGVMTTLNVSSRYEVACSRCDGHVWMVL